MKEVKEDEEMEEAEETKDQIQEYIYLVCNIWL